MSEQRLRERLRSMHLPVSESGRFVGFGPQVRGVWSRSKPVGHAL